jgi:hypothetical protein
MSLLTQSGHRFLRRFDQIVAFVIGKPINVVNPDVLPPTGRR